MRKIYAIIGLIGIVSSLVQADGPAHKKEKRRIKKEEINRSVKEVTGRMLSNVGSNFYNLFSLSTFYTGCYAVPLYVSARPLDHKIHQFFYSYKDHKNIHQPAKNFSKFALNTAAMVIPIVILRDILSSDAYHIKRGEVFITGIFMTWATKNIFKCARTEGNKRPWSESHSKERRAYGGNPSGHTALSGFIASFWAKEKGPLIGIPLVAAMGLEMTIAVITNRHYLSQVILGAAYGVVFGLAAHKTLEKSVFSENTKIGLVANPSTGLGLKLSYNF